MHSSNNRSNNKIAYIYRDNNSTKKELGFSYDAMGNRIAKHIYSATGVWEKSTYYVRDASGNTMAVYEKEVEMINTDTDPELEEVMSYQLTERHIYGSSRLGIDTEHIEMVDAELLTTNTDHRALGQKQYELSNHLGNVLSVISDIKLPVVDEGLIVSYTAVVVSATDYSAFGVALYGRTWVKPNADDYRYGFQNQEQDAELWEGAVTFKYRVEDARLGRFFSVDPLYRKYPWNSSFAVSENRLLDGIELEGREWEEIITEYGNVVAIQVTININAKTLPTGLSLDDYEFSIQQQFNQTIFKSSFGQLSGIVKFDNTASEEETGRLVPGIYFSSAEPKCFGPYTIAGSTTWNFIQLNLYNSDGSVVPVVEVGNTVVHELFHTLILDHPFDETCNDIDDTDLINDGNNNYSMTIDTHPFVMNNVMMYDMMTIDGQRPILSDMDLLTPGQMEFVSSEIQNQMAGAGVSISSKSQYYSPCIETEEP